ncbi:hypothetical protein HanOQP8_Chr15g0561461 [Helianthus annuus]|nr:hypothetical protein HanIR_Chr15g0737921 [Helianthus annuus]KAJ0472013.1 hypothetical protein HanHA89_Chr15g0602311 [Helianthus annuus]KAJ0651484.1 hypothetical protein HanOQP8_Chr15g0561461 [Helianthus annuus]
MWWNACISLGRCRFNSHLVQSEVVGNDRRPRETWVRSLSKTGGLPCFPRNWWWTRVTLGVLRLVRWVPRECSRLILLAVQKNRKEK